MHAAISWARGIFDAARNRQRRLSPTSRLRIETLETRSLLSATYVPLAAAAPRVPAVMYNPPTPISSPGHLPVTDSPPPTTIVAGRVHPASGVVAKTPRYYEGYTGPKLAELNAVKASVKLAPSNVFQLTGMNKGAISPNVPALFVFGIDRNGHLPTGPFPNRPNVRFDAVVVASVGSNSGPSGTVIDLANNTVTPLPAGAVSVHGRSVAINVSAGLLPSTGLSPSQYRFNYWPETVPGKQANLVASFLPEFGTAQVGTVRGRR